MARPNGSRLRCGRSARGRKAVGRQAAPAAQRSDSLKAITARHLQALVRPAAHLGSPFAALRNGLGCSISEIDDRAGGATNCLEHPEQDWVTTLCRGTGARWLLRRRRRRFSTYGGGRSPPWGHELALFLGLSLAVLLPFGRFIVDRRSTFTGDVSLTHLFTLG